MENPVNHVRALPAIAVLFLALFLVGVVGVLVRSFKAANAAPQFSRAAVTERVPRAHRTAPRTGEKR